MKTEELMIGDCIKNTINHEYYISLEVAKLLKEAGFDWKCRGIYVLDSENDPEYIFSTANFTNTSKEIEGYIRLSAPTLEIAQRWLRVVKQIHLYVRPILDEHKYVVTVVVDDLTWGQVNDNNGTSKRFNTYEEAQEMGIKKAIEIILEKGE